MGQAYRFTTEQAAELTIAFHYLARDLPPGYEQALNLYYSPDEGASWQRLPTLLDLEENLAAAAIPANAQVGPGIYALLATLDLPQLTPGWNLVSYPLAGSRAVSSALASLEGAYTALYGFSTAEGVWRLYDPRVTQNQPSLAPLVNDLHGLEFGRSYWLYATRPMTPYLGVEGAVAATAGATLLPPATFYGLVTGSQGPVGARLTARVGGQACGAGVVQAWQGQRVYKVQVAADVGDGCGAVGRPVTLYWADGSLAGRGRWENRQAQFAPLGAGGRLWLPLVAR